MRVRSLRVDPSVKLEVLESIVAPKLRSEAIRASRQANQLGQTTNFYAEPIAPLEAREQSLDGRDPA